uniref:Uncharacterized protein n=1 Tax=Solibacter usitatus (strain Ellin6076) TaxID=234267 RepID=Q01XZ8_SOLUE
MQIDLECLRRHYSSLSDEGLLALDPDDLIEVARKCWDEEVERRGLDELMESDAVSGDEAGETETSFEGLDPDWLQNAACACSFVGDPGGSQASGAVKVLDDAGIPCEVTIVEVSSALGRHPAEYEYRVMVPAALNLKASSILDKEIFNPQLEADWRLHFQSLTDSELGALNPNVICIGLADRIARLKRAYNDEVTRRFRHSE